MTLKYYLMQLLMKDKLRYIIKISMSINLSKVDFQCDVPFCFFVLIKVDLFVEKIQKVYFSLHLINTVKARADYNFA